MNVNLLIQQLPAYQGKERLITRRQSTYDIIQEMLRKHSKTAAHYDMLDPKQLWKGNVEATARALFDLCKQNIGYVVEPTLTQTVKTPAAILVEGQGDCKHYASIIVGICCALQRKGYPIQAKYRFASYDKDKRHPGHVFAVVMDGGRELWVDPVLPTFNQRYPQYSFKQDKIPPMERAGSIGSLYDISGIPWDAYISGPDSRGADGVTEYRRPAARSGHWLDDMPVSGLADKRDRFQSLTKSARFQNIPAAPPPPPPPAYTPPQAYDEDNDGSVGKHGKGKAKLKKALHKAGDKLKHIKVKPGKLLKKLVGATPRNAYLALLKLNFTNKAVQMHNKIKGHPENWKKLHDFWVKAGGDPNKLRTAISNGVATHNKLHPKHKVSGLEDHYGTPFFQPAIGDNESVGVVAAAAPALIAAALPVIKAISNVLKSLGINNKDSEDAGDNADVNAADAHNGATEAEGDGNSDIMPDGTVDHGQGVKTKVTTDANGKQTISYDVDDPTETVTKTKTKTTTTSKDNDGDGDPDEVESETTKTKTKSVTKSEEGGGMMAFWDNTKNYVMEHKMGVGLTAVGAGLLIYSIAHKFPKKSSAPVMLGIAGGIGVVVGGVQLFKK